MQLLPHFPSWPSSFVRSNFSPCTGEDISEAAWQQAQLSLSKEGLGLEVIAHHSRAAYTCIASVSSSEFGNLSRLLLSEAKTLFILSRPITHQANWTTTKNHSI